MDMAECPIDQARPFLHPCSACHVVDSPHLEIKLVSHGPVDDKGTDGIAGVRELP
jgi:hypothetical protein